MAQHVGKSEIKCHRRWLELSGDTSALMAITAWTRQEDQTLARLVQENGPKEWAFIASHLPGRIGKQCRERWHHHLDPAVIKKKWSMDEDKLIIQLYLRFSSRWSEIAKHVEGRTDNQIKNRFNSNLKRRLNDEPFAEMIKKYNERLERGDGALFEDGFVSSDCEADERQSSGSRVLSDKARSDITAKIPNQPTYDKPTNTHQ